MDQPLTSPPPPESLAFWLFLSPLLVKLFYPSLSALSYFIPHLPLFTNGDRLKGNNFTFLTKSKKDILLSFCVISITSLCTVQDSLKPVTKMLNHNHSPQQKQPASCVNISKANNKQSTTTSTTSTTSFCVFVMTQN